LEVAILASVLAVFTLMVAILYTKRISEAHERYVRARSAFDDVIVSFNRQLRRQEDQLEISARKMDVLSNRSETFAERFGDQKKEIQLLADRVESFPVMKKLSTRIATLEKKLSEIASKKDTLSKKITELEKQQSPKKSSEAKIESAIPIKREKALAPLTETELTVLEFLATEGEKTAPEIREQIELSREHTARLMKKLYEKGYLDRSSIRIPFTYHLKEEMRKILAKPEQKS